MSDMILISELSDAELDFIGAGGGKGGSGGGGGSKPSKTVNKYNFHIVQKNYTVVDAYKSDVSVSNSINVAVG